MEEPQKDPQTTTTPPPSAVSTQAVVQDVVMEEVTTTANTSNSNNEKEDKVQTDPATTAVNNQRIVEEFQYLLEKSQQLFAGLRDLPPTGGRQWQPYFQRTFEVYTKLWKFQQQNRFVLEVKENYGLKRWEVGEIASKIGQLYYHYYLRTSETNYLHESYIFYEAIRERSYFKDVLDVKNPALMIKKLRYYARFIVVCLLLNNRDIVQKLMDELSGLVDDYIKIFKPVDSNEWQGVLNEIANFLEAEKKLVPVSTEGHLLSVVRRLQIERSLRLEKDGTPKLKLQEAILVGNYQNQIKFSELTLDMYHILQSLEREPAPLKSAPPKTPGSEVPTVNERVNSKDDTSAEEQNANTSTDKPASRRVNPHKYLLYRPTFSQLLVYIATAFKEINENSALLLYISADGSKRSSNNEQTSCNGYNGGVATSSRKPTDKTDSSDSSGLINCLHPADLVPFSRKPLCLIIDSDNSTAFADFPRVFNQPFLCLMSPVEYPSSITDTPQIGSLFTLFLHAPLLGFAFISDLGQISSETWEKCVNLVSEAELKIVELFNSSNIEKPLKRFLQDDFLRQFLVKFVLCQSILKAHIAFKEEKHFLTSCPQLPSSIYDSQELLTKIYQMVKEAQVESYYSFPTLEILETEAVEKTVDPEEEDEAIQQ
ncbi:12924_t:CDS:10 [Funneliformis caledonium]|uniref:12924_t:CDS:1 n=1 Tax=Funneliformis caledonium TaxID=1117310 RepID=A0A9N9H3P5_9GLOM|nr:12924_t:CDS:10 [Funneliformis caledonium]